MLLQFTFLWPYSSRGPLGKHNGGSPKLRYKLATVVNGWFNWKLGRVESFTTWDGLPLLSLLATDSALPKLQ